MDWWVLMFQTETSVAQIYFREKTLFVFAFTFQCCDAFLRHGFIQKKNPLANNNDHLALLGQKKITFHLSVVCVLRTTKRTNVLSNSLFIAIDFVSFIFFLFWFHVSNTKFRIIFDVVHVVPQPFLLQISNEIK